MPLKRMVTTFGGTWVLAEFEVGPLYDHATSCWQAASAVALIDAPV